MAAKTGYRTQAQEELLAYLKASPGTHHGNPVYEASAWAAGSLGSDSLFLCLFL